ncbi:MAG: prepilin-type N-terminal cleavage/methylation domain-containing protein [Thermodesulfobacteriota bacterium]|nr:prepilin-type N-terminal cleavage/methylation domain-containing protein [Thermodesulfobacteriota bacterium]
MYAIKDKTSIYKERGYTLIEVLIALAIFSIGILGVGTMQIRSTGGNTGARISTEASIWGQDLVETLMLRPYSDALLTPGNHPPPVIPGTVAGNYQMQWTVWDDSGTIAGAVTQNLNGTTPSSNTKVIEVTITGRGNRSSTVVFVRAQDV